MLVVFPDPGFNYSVERRGISGWRVELSWSQREQAAVAGRDLRGCEAIDRGTGRARESRDGMFRLVLEQYLNLHQLRERIAKQAALPLKGNSDSRRLMTAPGIGPSNALTILAEAGDLRRFRRYRQFLNFCGLSLSTLQSGKSRGQSHISKYRNARLRNALWLTAHTTVRMRENSFRRKFDNYVRTNPLDADLRRKAYIAVAAKLARVTFGLIKHQVDYRPFFEHQFQVEEPYRASAVGAVSTP
jgi:transposase